MPDYRYTFVSLRDEQVLEEIDLYGVYAQRILNDAGQFNGTFQLDQTGKRNQDLVAATIPGRTWLVMERDNVPVWWGIVWSRTYQSEAKSVQIFAWGFESFPASQVMLSDFSRVGQNQLQTFADLWADMQSSRVGRDLAINIPASIPSTINKDVTILATDAKLYSDVMQSLSNASDGFDYTIQVSKVGGGFRKDLVMGYPYLGSNLGPEQLVFEYPGSILNYYETESMANAGTHIFGYGAGEGASQLVSVAGFDTMITALGWPRWDKQVSMKDIDNLDQLSGLTIQEAIKRRPPMNT